MVPAVQSLTDAGIDVSGMEDYDHSQCFVEPEQGSNSVTHYASMVGSDNSNASS